ncbi:MAG: multicopper oxidase domain-containing protein [Gemmatimonas sp.]
MNRRDALLGIGLGALGVMNARGPTGMLRHRPWSSSFEPDVDLSLVAAPDEVQIRSGARTRVWRFTGTVIKGPATSLQSLPGSYLGPVIRVRRGQKVRIRFRNDLAEPSIVHWHGLDVPEAADGHPHLAIGSGSEYVYEFEVLNRAGTYWYHPHPHGKTGSQVYWGLAGILVVTDDEEDALPLPRGAEEFVCVLQDRTFDAQNQFAYLAGGMMDQMHGLLGERQLVNGAENTTHTLATRAYRIRLLNASSTRVYKLMWDDGTPMTIIGADGGLLEQPLEQPFLTLAPSQRADVILDLSQRAIGTSVQLRSAPFAAAEVSIDTAGMMGGMGGMRGSAPSNGASLLLMTVRVARKEVSSFRLPTRLSPYGPAWAVDTAAPVRRIALDFRAGQWLIDGRSFDMMDVAPEDIVRAGSTHVWEIANIGGMMGQQMAHPFHVHGTQFRILSRTRPADATLPSGSVREGLVDAGWHDTVLVMPRETVRLQMHFTTYTGLFLYHCHILEHEDMGMMRNFRVNA